jgi:NADH dehydrogenase FAD-containing subunit
LTLLLLLQYTPLLPAVAVGTVEEASICEPVRLLVKDKVGCGCLQAKRLAIEY